MTCTENRLLLHADADNELDAGDSFQLEQHLKTCTVCQAERSSLVSLKTAFQRAALRHEAPNSLRKKVHHVVYPSTGVTRPRLLQSLLFWKSLAFGATAIALLAVVLQPGLTQREGLSNQVVASHVRSLMVEHLTDVTSSDQHTVKPWFNGKLDFAPEVRDWAEEGFPLIGGRLDYLNGRRVAALVYRRKEHPINVLVWPAGTTGAGSKEILKHRGYSIINREYRGLHYCLVSDLNEKELTLFADLLGR